MITVGPFELKYSVLVAKTRDRTCVGKIRYRQYLYQVSETEWELTASCFAHSEEDVTGCDMDWPGMRDPKGHLVPKQDHGVQGLILLIAVGRLQVLGSAFQNVPARAV